MQTRKSLLLSAGVIAIVALLASTNAFAQFETCTSQALNKRGTAEDGDGNFIVSVEQTTLAGRTTYKYSVARTPGSNANPTKFFVYVRHGLDSEDGFSAQRLPTQEDGEYVTPHDPGAGGFPPAETWLFTHHEDGVAFTAIAINNQYTVDVKSRFKPESSLTTVLLGIGSTFEHCGPIFGPKNEATPVFEGSPLQSTRPRLSFDNGCSYFATVEPTTGVITSLEGDPDTPFETNFPEGEQPQACVALLEESCETDLVLEHCGIGNIAYPPIQSEPGGTCYYPPNIKFPC